MYLIKNVPADQRKLEMCFDCSAFQYQLEKDTPLEEHVFQTIFLNKKHKETWSMDEIRKDKISECTDKVELMASSHRLVASALP
jgi:hypothetical protein